MHHVSSPTFSKILDTNYCRYKIGLSGTIERKDGKHVVFRDYFGNTLFKPPKENYMTPTVHIVNNEPLLTQLVGRVIRKKEGKIDPVIIDIHLKGNTARKQASNRVGFYMKQGWNMKYL